MRVGEDTSVFGIPDCLLEMFGHGCSHQGVMRLSGLLVGITHLCMGLFCIKSVKLFH